MNFESFANFSAFDLTVNSIINQNSKVLFSASDAVQGYDVTVEGELAVYELDINTETLRFEGPFLA